MTSIEKAVEKVAARRKEEKDRLGTADDSSRIESSATVPAREPQEARETVLRYVEEPEANTTSTNHVAKLDLEMIRARGMLAPENGESSLAEQFRRIKRPLLNNAFGTSAMLVENGNLIMVTSAAPEEGKTYVTVSLAVSIAMELDKTVLLVDADMVKETATKLFHKESDLGLLDVIVDSRVRLEDAIIRTDVPKLSLLPAGRYRAKATELISSDAMRLITQELASRYDDRVILFDSPPLLATSEASVLASLMGQIVLVIEAEKTTQSRVKEAMALLDENKPIGIVFNKSRSAARGGYYYGYYGYK